MVDSKGRKAKTPALLGSNLIHIAVNEFCKQFGEECLHLFECPVGISPLCFSTLCLYYYAHVHQTAGVGASSVKTDYPSNDKDKPNPSKPSKLPQIICNIRNVLPWQLWSSQSKFRQAIQIGVISHISPRHMESDGQRSLFSAGTTKVEIEEIICEALMFPTLEVMKFMFHIQEVQRQSAISDG